MPKVIRIGAGDIEQTHSGFGAKEPDGPGSPDVFVEGYHAAIVGDGYPTHICPGCCGDGCDIEHTGRTATGGSPTVYINNVGVHRDGDLINCGAAADGGAPTVFANGGGAGPAEGDEDFTGYIIEPPVWVGPKEINLTIGVTEGQPDPLTDEIPYTQVWGCSSDSGIPDAYTRISEEDTGAEWPNYPPEHDPSGCPDCPSEANEQAKTPIDLTFTFWEVIVDPITGDESATPTSGKFGLSFDTGTGRISGCPDVGGVYLDVSPSATIRVRPENSYSLGISTGIITDDIIDNKDITIKFIEVVGTPSSPPSPPSDCTIC